MTERRPDLDPDVQLEEELVRERPVPRAAFRGGLGRHLAERDPGYGPRPANLWALVTGYTLAGLLLILVGLLVASGAL
jgi:hypothetical protein